MNIYESIATRTNGNIYVGVVGPVRTGKSTFISRFMEKMVLPNLENENLLERTKDELPQSGAGKLIMTMQPRFVPSDAAEISISGGVKANVRLVDCVGYLIDGVQGHMEEDKPRLVKTPWSETDIPFEKAAEIGTHKVITDHSTIGILVTTDGTITDIPRNNYVTAEERVVSELKSLNKPFVILLNTVTPEAEETISLKNVLEEKYGVAVLVKDVSQMTETDFVECLEKVLYQFPVRKMSFKIPEWMRTLDETNELISKLLTAIKDCKVNKMAEKTKVENLFTEDAEIVSPVVESIDLSTGDISFSIKASSALFYKTLSNITGVAVDNDLDLMKYIANATVAKSEYDKLKSALEKATETGYGVVYPNVDEMELSPPEVIKKGVSNSIKLRAKAPSLHIMKVDVETEVTPAVGGIDFSETGDESQNNEIWNTSVFGRTLTDIAHEGIVSKLNTFPEEAEVKMRKTLSKITNEGKGGIICILL